MKRNNLSIWGILLLLLALGSSASAREDQVKRTMGVNVGPERVFERPVEEIVPELSGAEAMGSNGRVGNELVFWSYQLSDGRDVLLYACAALENVDCDLRALKICPAGLGPEFIAQTIEPGEVRRLNCRFTGTAMPGDPRPNCDEYDRIYDLQVGLASCQ